MSGETTDRTDTKEIVFQNFSVEYLWNHLKAPLGQNLRAATDTMACTNIKHQCKYSTRVKAEMFSAAVICCDLHFLKTVSTAGVFTVPESHAMNSFCCLR